MSPEHNVAAFIGPGERPPPALVDPTFPAHSYRADIEGLRAVAVIAVLAYHAKVGPFSGGFVGVDVFFVLSGFLISSLLLREVAATGTISLANFWARRSRRLLPASCLVVVITLVLSRLMLDPLSQRDLVRDGFSASFFAANILFAWRDSDYFAAGLDPSPLLHFWSLSLEEQFYFVWPLLLLVITRNRVRRWINLRRAIITLWVGSFAWCVWLTPRRPAWAFYALPTRAWELLTGAVLALAGTALIAVPRRLRSGAAWIGLGAIVGTALVYDDLTVFPGSAVLVPVVATALVVGASAAGDAVGPAWLLQLRPMQWIGRRSYAIYLWHWPALTLVAAKYGPLNAPQRVVVVLGSIGIAALSFAFVEDPVRRSSWAGRRPRRGLYLGGSLIATSSLVCLALVSFPASLTGGALAAEPTLATAVASTAPVATTVVPVATTVVPGSPPGLSTTTSSTSIPIVAPIGPVTQSRNLDLLALVSANAPSLSDAAGTNEVPGNLRPSLSAARNDKPSIYGDGCILDPGRSDPPICTFGNEFSSTIVVLFGDSHAAQWFPALDDLARANNWRLEVHTKKACPTADISLALGLEAECRSWREKVAVRMAELRPDVIIMASYRYRPGRSEQGLNSDEVWRRGLDKTLTTFRPVVDQVLLLGDTPTPLQDIPSCLAGHLHNVGACLNQRSVAVRIGRLTVESELAEQHEVLFEPTSDWLCADTTCPVIIGDLLVYRDHNHITTAAAQYLEPYLAIAVEAALAS